jgi:hypothetical protein
LTWRGGGYGFLFRSEIFFRTTQESEYFFLSRKTRNIFPEFNVRLYDKNSESDYFFFPPPKSEYFFQQHWESEYLKKKTHNPSLQVKWSFPYRYFSFRFYNKFLTFYSFLSLLVIWYVWILNIVNWAFRF